jgi:signal transduction histidine kinase
MRKISLTEKIILNFLLLGVGMLVIIATYSFYTSKNALMNRTFEQLTSVRTVKKNQIESFFSDRNRDIRLISGSDDIKKLLTILNNHNQTYKSNNLPNKQIDENQINEEYNRYLRLYLNSCGYYNNLFIFNQNGLGLKIKTSNNQKSLISYDSISNYPLNELKDSIYKTKKVYLQDFKLNKITNIPSMYVGSPIFGNNKQLIGIIVLEISYDAINAIMFENNPHNGLGKTGESYLVGNDNLMRSSSRFHENALLKTSVKTMAVKNAFGINSGTEIINDYRKIDVLSAYIRLNIPHLKWCIIAEIDLKEATIPVYNLRNNTLFISILLALILFISAFIISRRITRPIIKLKDAAIKIGKGEFNEQLPVYSYDEIGALTESFNFMMSHLEQQSKELQLERKLRLQSVIDGQEMERQRLSRELHDGLGQLLIAIKLRLEGLIFTDRSKLIYTIEGIKKLFDSTIDEVKRISYDLMPAVLFEFGLVKAIRNLCDDIETRSRIKTNLIFECDSDKLDKLQKTYLFRIIQEAMNNIVKHAEASRVDISLSLIDNTIHLFIADNGKGFNLEERIHSLNTNGIYNMRERVNLLNGSFEINSIIKNGTTIKAVIPLYSKQ